MANRPLGRKKQTGGSSSGVHRRGEGKGTGPVGSRPSSSGSGKGLVDDLIGSALGGGGGASSGPDLGNLIGGLSSMAGGVGSSSGSGKKKGGIGIGGIIVVIVILFFLMRSGACSGMLGGADAGSAAQTTTTNYGQGGLSSGQSGSTDLFGSLLGGMTGSAGSNMAVAWDGGEANTGKLDTTVAEGSRAKRTRVIGGGADVFTIMVYMCGTDLESRSAMASRDLQEMANATIGENVNLLVYTGGCNRWQNSFVSSDHNQIYQVKTGGVQRLVENAGNGAMTDPATLASFIQWGAKNYPANRNALIFWDHGGGSNTGYGYDEKNKGAGSMTLAGINTALQQGGITYDFIGFDTCLMATVENALVCENYADYMIASEETEPGVGWYYTDWLTNLSADTSRSTLEIGRNIIDSFTSACASGTPGQSTTLSLVDLAELAQTVPSAMTAFAQSTSDLIQNNAYKTVSEARSGAREFAQQSRIDQVDLVHLAKKMGTPEGENLANALLGAIKYNQTSSRMTNSYGLSVYFPYQRASSVDQMVNTYQKIGMDADYTRCIQQFASLGVAGQVAAGGSSSASPLGGLFGDLLGGGAGSLLGGGSSSGASGIASMLSQYMSGGFSGIEGLDKSNTKFLEENLDVEQAAEYIAVNALDDEALGWQTIYGGEDAKCIVLPEEQWALVQDLDLAMFYDDGEGYVDLGLDNVFTFDDAGNLEAPTDRTWLAIEGRIVAYYRMDAVGDEENYTITGYVPAELNGDRVNLILVFDAEHPGGYIAGANYDYKNGETETVAKNLTEIAEGDKIDFLCDFYDYEGNYSDSYNLGETLVVDKPMEELQIDNRDVGDGTVKTAYRFTDIYGQAHWTDFIELEG